MLGAFGFLSAAAILAIFGWSANKLSKSNKKFESVEFSSAYFSAALAMICWGIAVASNSFQLEAMVLAGDAFILLALILLTHLAFPIKFRNYLVCVVGLVSLAALYFRSQNNDAVITDGLLIFNTPRIFGLFLAAAIFFIWLRANLAYFDAILENKKVANDLRPVYFATNLIGLVSVFAFLFARKELTIISAFAGMLVSFLVLLAINLYLLKFNKAGKAGNGK